MKKLLALLLVLMLIVASFGSTVAFAADYFVPPYVPSVGTGHEETQPVENLSSTLVSSALSNTNNSIDNVKIDTDLKDSLKEAVATDTIIFTKNTTIVSSDIYEKIMDDSKVTSFINENDITVSYGSNKTAMDKDAKPFVHDLKLSTIEAEKVDVTKFENKPVANESIIVKTIKNNGHTVPGTITVPATMADGTKLNVYHVEGNTYTALGETKVVNGYASFDFDSFSYYLLTTASLKTDKPTPTPTPAPATQAPATQAPATTEPGTTGTAVALPIGIVLAALVVVAIIAVVIVKKKKTK